MVFMAIQKYFWLFPFEYLAGLHFSSPFEVKHVTYASQQNETEESVGPRVQFALCCSYCDDNVNPCGRRGSDDLYTQLIMVCIM